MIKGFNIPNALHHTQKVSIPLALEVFKKFIVFCDV